MATTYKSTQMTNYTAGPPSTKLKSSEHNRVHRTHHTYTTTGAETAGDSIEIGFVPIDAKILPLSRVDHGATVSGYFTVGDAGDPDRFKTETDATSASSFNFDRLANLDWEVDSAANQTILLTVSSGTLAASVDIDVALCYMY